MHIYRTHTCNDLRLEDIDQTVRLSGWVHRRRDHGGVLFIDLRDHYGITQLVCQPEMDVFSVLEGLSSETVVTVTGRVVARQQDAVNSDLATGSIEIHVEEAVIQSTAQELPLPVFGDAPYPEDIRLKYRFLDLRRQRLHHNIVLRSQVIAFLRQKMQSLGFMEFQTPILTASSPEGARDFLVPSRLHPGQFYALPQAPQQFKQLVMVSGFDRYFQIAPCFRDEDARADRSPGEFYQLDIEMSFVTQDDVLTTLEPVVADVFAEFAQGRSVMSGPFPRIPYKEAMLRYGSDKPDLRNPILISDVSSVFVSEDCQFQAFKKVVAGGGCVRAIPAPAAAAKPRSFFDNLNDWARQECKAPGLGYIIFEEVDGQLSGRGPIAKFLTADLLRNLAEQAGVGAGDALFFAAGGEGDAAKLAGLARNRIGALLELKSQDYQDFMFCWVVDYPMFEWDDKQKKIDFSHNPFSMPQGGMEALENKDPLDILAYQYDIVCNGIELSSGAIRNHLPEIMYKAFAIAGHGAEVVEERFGGMINAFRYGAPPHGGMAPGVDRIVMLLADVENIREVTLFPMNQRAEDLMMGAPATVGSQQLADVHIELSQSAIDEG